ncbi:MAG: hypothetical protein L0I80_00370 [Brevibacterium sp.]|uniref:hypothetical protein n=1 Tax=Brevibacterium sp. TaxID=1701 RepID=UPI00264745D7|nr:hypothetical protein [Brevibacterium sp.]MDN5807975.1 hypothetical protein [Brevibacterium sp.]MDN5834486.1 hypothetical protein [Brevibacterium sp.]MDN5877137.1 hypothetical protein [Brevibacterium sp.]MDN5909491.1 hypothetical protein [Brevibacterium sp.]MDN6122312.1 hypothetical protein [Brevibacterium sp.]
MAVPEHGAKQAKRSFLEKLRRLTFLNAGLLFFALGLSAAVILHTVQWVYSGVILLDAQRRGAGEVCETALPEIDRDDFEIASRAPWGYACETNIAGGGFAVQDHPGATSALFSFTIAIVAVSVVVLVGALSAAAAKRAMRAVLGNRGGPAVAWGVGLLIAACVLAPWTLLAQRGQWYMASHSGTGSPVCPDTFQGDEMRGYSVNPVYVPPHLTCHGSTVSGHDFTTTYYGWPFFAFLGCVVLLVVAAGLLTLARLRSRGTQKSEPQVVEPATSPSRSDT